MTRAQLKKLRKEHGLSATQLAKLMGVCRKTALNYVAGRNKIKEEAASKLITALSSQSLSSALNGWVGKS